MNEEISSETVRVIGPEGKQLGVLVRARALEMATEFNLDLVEIVPTA